MSTAYWRIRPTLFVEEGVRKIAEREGRSITNACHKLLTEALISREGRQRRHEEMKAKAAERDALIAAIRGEATEKGKANTQ
jgi:hypothetical protein